MNRVLMKFGWPIFYFLMTFVIAGFWARIGIDVHHDGIMLKPALDVAQGLRLFGDTFSQYGAITTLLQAAAIELFGEKLIVIRLLTAFFYALISVLFWYIWKQVLSPLLVLVVYILWMSLAGFLVMTFLPWSSVYALFFQVATIGTLVAWQKNGREKPSYLLVSGLLIGCTFLSRQPVGFMLLAAVLAWLVIFRGTNEKYFSIKILRDIALLLTGLASVGASFFIWLFLTHSIKDWWIQSIIWPRVWAARSLTDNWMENLRVLYFIVFEQVPLLYKILPIVSIGLGLQLLYAYYIRKDRSHETFVLSLVALVAIGSWHQFYPISCPRHTWWASAPMFGLFVCSAWKFSRLTPTWIRLVVFGFLIHFSFSDIIVKNYTIAASRFQEAKAFTIVKSPSVLRGMLVRESAAENFEKISASAKSLEEASGEVPIYIGHSALYSTLVPHYKNYHKLTVLWDGLPELYNRENVKILENLLSKGGVPVLVEGEVLPFSSENYTKRDRFLPNGEYEGIISLYGPKKDLSLK